MTRQPFHVAALMACGLGLSTAVPFAAATAQPLAPLIDQNVRPLAQSLRTFVFQTPYVFTNVGVSWDREVYVARPDSYAPGQPCNGSLVVWAECLNNPKSPEVSATEFGSAGAQTNTAGEVIARQIQTTPMSGANRPTEGSASAKGATDIGSNRLYAAARGGFEREVFFPSSTSFQSGGSGGSTEDERLWMSAGGNSIWSTTFTPTFTGSMTIGLSAFLHGGADEESAFLGQIPLGGNRDAEATLGFGVFDPSQQMFYGSEFEYATSYDPSKLGPAWVTGLSVDAASSYGLTGYALAMDVVAGRSYSMVMRLRATVYQNGLLDLFGTSKVDYFEVPDGGAVNFGGGNFTVRTAGGGGEGSGPITSVPEPSTLALMAAGLGLIVVTRRRRAVASRR